MIEKLYGYVVCPKCDSKQFSIRTFKQESKILSKIYYQTYLHCGQCPFKISINDIESIMVVL